MMYNIGYTTGVFDLFHIGHLNVLRNAKNMCRYLIVGVSTDETVMQYKHKKPIIPFEERIEIVRAIKFVDEAVPQTDMDKMHAWNNLHFDALFHGDDWKNTSLYDQYIAEFKKVGVDVVFLPHTQGTSSTEISKRLHDAP